MQDQLSGTAVPGAKRRSPVFRAMALTFAVMLVNALLAGIINLVAPGLESIYQRLIGVLVLCAVAVSTALVTRFPVGWRIRSPHLLILPAALALLPFLGGMQSVAPAFLAVILVGEAATGVFEELWFRGLVMSSLNGWGVVPAVLTVSVLFGLTHLGNILYGADPLITAAQIVGAFTFGVGYAALRLRTIALWPLMILHAVTDIALAVGNVSGGLRWGIMIGSDTVLFIYGLLLLRALPRGTSVAMALAAGAGTVARLGGRHAA